MHYWLVLAASYGAVTFAFVSGGDWTVTTNSIWGLVGAGFGLALIPLLALRILGVTGGWITMVLLSAGYLQTTLGTGSPRDPAAESFTYVAPGCEFSVEFPGKPTLQTYSSPEFGDYEQAQWISEEADETVALRTDCIAIPGLGVRLGEQVNQTLVDHLIQFANNNGLSAVEYSYDITDAGPTARARGVKRVQGVPLTYQVAVVAGSTSLLSVYAGGPSATYPQREVEPFLSSVKLK